MAGAALVAAGVLLGPPAWAQQDSYSDGRSPAPRPVPPIDIMQLPRDACVWGNAIYSNGAVMVQPDLFTTYFQCERGAWSVIAPGDAIFRRRAAAQPGGASAVRP
jgi:hypothetical protein